MEKGKIVGQVTSLERDEIRLLFERRHGLEELIKIIDPEQDDKLYDKIVMDMGRTLLAFQKWWDEKAQTYSWEKEPNCHWEINFDERTIILIQE